MIHEADERGPSRVEAERADRRGFPVEDHADIAVVKVVPAAWVAVGERQPVGCRDPVDGCGDSIGEAAVDDGGDDGQPLAIVRRERRRARPSGASGRPGRG